MGALEPIFSLDGKLGTDAVGKQRPSSSQKINRVGEMTGFTEREIEVLELLLQGRTNKQIAASLGISDFTVRDHVSSLLRKSGASTRTELAFFAALGVDDLIGGF